MPDMGAQERTRGFTPIEVATTITVLVIGFVALAGVMVPISQQSEQVAAKSEVTRQARSVLEQIKGLAPENVASTYNGATYFVQGITGTNNDGSALTVTVDSTNPKLVVVTVTGSWVDPGGTTETVVLRTEIYSSKGQL